MADDYQSVNTAKNTIGQPQYVIESTLKGSRLTGADMPDHYLPLTSIPSVVLVGQYKIGGEAKSFYTYQKNAEGLPEIYAANDGDIAGVKTIHDRLLETQTVILKRSGTRDFVQPILNCYSHKCSAPEISHLEISKHIAWSLL